MKNPQFKIVMFVILIFIAGLPVYNIYAAESKIDFRQIADVAKAIGAVFPENAQIVDREESLRFDENGNPDSLFLVIFSSTPVKFNKAHVARITSETSIEILKNRVKKRRLGKLKDKYTYYYEGRMNNVAYRVHQTHFETGSYLTVMLSFGACQ